ncbi:MAG: hypothetical protein EOP48_17670 [Sphingobacteriales bacterium]|nr:MAG: hypothetical protein EOP48_17670 [Sphingobacteriales bacterium]
MIYTQIHKPASYEDLLSCDEWIEFRQKIVTRDLKRCQHCSMMKTSLLRKSNGELVTENGKAVHCYLERNDTPPPQYVPSSSTFNFTNVIDNNDRKYFNLIKPGRQVVLHVHHKMYYGDKLPWEYKDEEVVTLCDKCHFDCHLSEVIPFYDNSIQKRITNYSNCIRCSGFGFFPEYHHVQKGICFRCKGNKYEELIGKNFVNR